MGELCKGLSRTSLNPKKSIYYFDPGNKSQRRRNPSVKISKKMLAAAMFLRKVQLVALG
jgi:hypothetical protein